MMRKRLIAIALLTIVFAAAPVKTANAATHIHDWVLYERHLVGSNSRQCRENKACVVTEDYYQDRYICRSCHTNMVQNATDTKHSHYHH